MRLIDADAVLDRYYADWEYHCITMGEDDRQWLKQCLEQADTIEAEPVKHGRWEWYVSPICLSGDLYYRCSVCGESDPWRMTTRGHANYCPNCGAKMDGAEP